MNHIRILAISSAIAFAAIIINLFLGERYGVHSSGEMPIVWVLTGIIALSVGVAAWTLVDSGWFIPLRPVYRRGFFILIAAVALAVGAWFNALRLWLM